MVGVVAGSPFNLWVFCVIKSFLDGCQRSFHAPMTLVGVYVITLALAIPATLSLQDTIATHLGSSMAGHQMAEGVSLSWWEEFRASTDGLERTFTYSIIGFAAILRNISSFLDRTPPPQILVPLIICYLTVWSFLIGGIFDRLARGKHIGSTAFFSACGTHFFRFCRLAIIVGTTYWLLLSVVHPWLFETQYEKWIHDFTVERNVFSVRLALYALFAILLGAVNLIFDYAKIRVVVEDRHSAIGALLAAVRFLRRNPWPTIGLYLLNVSLYLLILVVYAFAAPSVDTPVLLALIIGQTYIVVRLFAKLIFYSSQISYFQSQLAHANYVANPMPVWPESPTAEAIANSKS